MSEVQDVVPVAKVEPDSDFVAAMDQRVYELIRQSEAYKALVAEIELLKKGQKKQGEDHKKLWDWVKKLDLRVVRAERNEPPAKVQTKGESEA